MQVQVRYFASLREATGIEREHLALPTPATVADARSALVARHPMLATLLPRCATAINHAYVEADRPLDEGDELAFLPPVGGG